MQRICGEEQNKISFQGKIISIQPRSNVWRYLVDNRTHSLTGYNIFISGTAEGEEKQFAVAISEKQQKKYELKNAAVEEIHTDKAPWIGALPNLTTYDWLGARMLDAKCWKNKCFQCKWAAMANVAIEYDFGVSQKHRFESFCYGPKNCKFYKMGRARAVPYKGRGSALDEGWLDEICTENRDDEE